MWGALAGLAISYFANQASQRESEGRKMGQQADLNSMALKQERDSILGRVDAAKAAGIHPLVAMGGQGLGGPVVSASGGDSFNPGFSFPQEKVDNRNPDQRRYEKARADLMELDLEASRKRLATQPGNGGAVNELTGTGKVVPAEATPYPVSHVKIEGQTLPPASKTIGHQTPGVAPGWDVVQMSMTSDGRPMRLVVPGGAVQRENWGEQLGEVPMWLWPEIVRQSAEASKMSKTEWVERVLTGNSPSEDLRSAGDRWEQWRSANHKRNLARNPQLRKE